MTLCPICGAPRKPKTPKGYQPKTCGQPACLSEVKRRNAIAQGLPALRPVVAPRVVPPKIVPPVKPWVGLSHVDQYGLPGYPPPRSLSETPDESSQSVPTDCFSFSSVGS